MRSRYINVSHRFQCMPYLESMVLKRIRLNLHLIYFIALQKAARVGPVSTDLWSGVCTWLVVKLEKRRALNEKRTNREQQFYCRSDNSNKLHFGIIEFD